MHLLHTALTPLLPDMHIRNYPVGESNMGTNYGFIFFAFGVSCTILIDSAGFTELNFEVLNYFFVCVGLVGALLCSHLRFLTSSIVDEKMLKHHRNTSSVSSMF